MQAEFQYLLDDVQLGPTSSYQQLTLVPMYRRRLPKSTYITLSAAESRGLIEISETGSVPQLLVLNKSDLPILIPDGATLVGCNQNRVVNISVLIPPQVATTIPVSCIERGRWHSVSPHSASAEQCDPDLRKQMSEQSLASLKSHQSVHVDQSAVWKHVGTVLAASETISGTDSYNEVFSKTQSALAKYERHLGYPDGAVGLGIMIGGQVRSIDVFDRPDTLKELWPRIVQSAAVASLGQSSNPVNATDVKQFLREALDSWQGSFMPVGVGTHHRFECETAVANGLVYEGSVIHLAAFPGSKRPASSMGNAPAPAQQQRTWWRFWA